MMSRFVGSGTGSRTPVSGVRGQRPGPLDDTTLLRKCGAKLHHFFEPPKFFCIFFKKTVFFYANW